jgi:hypothetical protein
MNQSATPCTQPNIFGILHINVVKAIVDPFFFTIYIINVTSKCLLYCIELIQAIGASKP